MDIPRGIQSYIGDAVRQGLGNPIFERVLAVERPVKFPTEPSTEVGLSKPGFIGSNVSKDGCLSISNFKAGMAALKDGMRPTGWEHGSGTVAACSSVHVGRLRASGELHSGVCTSGTHCKRGLGCGRRGVRSGVGALRGLGKSLLLNEL